MHLLPLRNCWPGFLAAVIMLAGCQKTTPTPTPPAAPPPAKQLDRIDDALRAAAKYLTSKQSPDGAWRSETYGALKDGASLTPLALEALSRLDDTDAPAVEKATQYLLGMVQPDGTIDSESSGLTYPVYTAALAVIVLSRQGESQQKPREAWLAFLRQWQLTEELGWEEEDAFYGGWGYARHLPRKPAADQPFPPLGEPNLSATVFALEALRAAGAAADDPAAVKALKFVKRCQNFSGTAKQTDPLNDGGFFFVQQDWVRNKAGGPKVEENNKQENPPFRRFYSYGSATADGLRCLLLCGLDERHPRVAAARKWLTDPFSPRRHPGAYAADREHDRQSLYYYYCASAATALQQLNVVEAPAEKGDRGFWAEELADELLRRQREDGSWQNAAVEVREDDPLVATSLAIIALDICRNVIRRR